MKRTTIKLKLTLADFWRLHERQIRDGATGAAMVVALLLIHALLKPAPQPTPAPLTVQQLQPAILVLTATPAPTQPPLPTATPWPTAEPIVIEVPGPTPEPIVIEVPIYIAAEPAPVAQEPEPPPVPTLAPQQLVILDRQQWAQQAAER